MALMTFWWELSVRRRTACNLGCRYFVFGKMKAFVTTLMLFDLKGSNDVRLGGVSVTDGAGYAIFNAGDANGDDVDELVIGTFGAEPNGDRFGSS